MKNEGWMKWMSGAVIAVLLVAGCGREAGETPETAAGLPDRVPEVAADLPPFEVDAEAPRLADTYPRLSSGVLSQARLMPLPAGTLLRTDSIALGEAELAAELEKAPPMYRDMMRENAFMMVEQMATVALLEAEAKQHLGQEGMEGAAMPKDALLQTWIEGLVSDVAVSDEEIEVFYNENREMMGGALLEEVGPQLTQHLSQQKQQEVIEQHIRQTGQRVDIAVDAAWAAAQDKALKDNPIDRARDSGMPTLASFGADTCQPCQIMKPFREAVAAAYEGNLEVVYVNVNQNQMLASRYGVQGIPHVIFFDASGAEVESRTGMMTQGQMEDVLKRMGVSRKSE